MSVYNRKMFKPRNARNALNMSAGIMPVQKFHAGGVVGHIHAGQTRNIRPTSSRSTITPSARRPQSMFTSPITGQSYRGPTPSGTGIASLQPSDIARRFIEGGRTVGYGDDSAISPGEYALLQASQTSNVAGNLIQDPTDTRLGGVVADVSRPFIQAGSGAVAFGRGLATQGLQSLLSSPDGAGTDTMGQRVAGMTPGALDQDYLTSLGFNQVDPTAYSAPIGPKPAPTKIPEGGMAADRIKDDASKIPDGELAAFNRARDQAREVTQRDGVYVTDEETGAYPPSTDTLESAVDNLMRQRQADEAAYQENVKQTDRDDATVDLAGEATGAAEAEAAKKAGTDGDGTGTDGTGDGTGAGDGAPTGEEEIKRVINNGTQEEKQSTLDGFIKEFMDKAPGYEGADSGLILAKIGFAMAAGKSPRAIENIASAMSDGADMLIKDKAKKDEFNRQLKLSALQYGLTEKGKITAEERLLARENDNVAEMVVGKGGTTYNGREYKEGESVFISKGDLKAGTFPPNILGTAALTAIKNQAAANATSAKALLDAKKITPAQYDTQMSKYSKAVTSAINAESGISLLEGAMVTVTDGNVTGLKGAFQDTVRAGGAFLGMDLTKTYGDKTEVQNAMRAALQDVIPVTLGATQSANSISNRDVDFLITAYFGEGALNGGKLAFATQTESEMVTRLQRAADKMRKAQKEAFATMKTTEKFLAPLYQPGTTDSAMGILAEDQRRLQEAGLRAGGAEGAGVYVGGQKVVSSLGATRGDDGIIRFQTG